MTAAVASRTGPVQNAGRHRHGLGVWADGKHRPAVCRGRGGRPGAEPRREAGSKRL